MEKYSNQNNRTPEYQHYTGMKAWITLPAEDPWPVYVKVKVTQLCPTLCNPLDYTVHGILQARILEWVAFPFSRGWLRRNVKCLWKEKVRDNQLQSHDQCLKWGLSHICTFPILFSPWAVSDSLQPPWMAAHQASLSSVISCILLRFTCTELVMLSSPHLLWCPLLLLPSIFPSLREICPHIWYIFILFVDINLVFPFFSFLFYGQVIGKRREWVMYASFPTRFESQLWMLCRWVLPTKWFPLILPLVLDLVVTIYISHLVFLKILFTPFTS